MTGGIRFVLARPAESSSAEEVPTHTYSLRRSHDMAWEHHSGGR